MKTTPISRNTPRSTKSRLILPVVLGLLFEVVGLIVSA